jgi:hypothetical protein
VDHINSRGLSNAKPTDKEPRMSSDRGYPSAPKERAPIRLRKRNPNALSTINHYIERTIIVRSVLAFKLDKLLSLHLRPC